MLGFGIGSNITDTKMIEENDWEGIARLARKYTEASPRPNYIAIAGGTTNTRISPVAEEVRRAGSKV